MNIIVEKIPPGLAVVVVTVQEIMCFPALTSHHVWQFEGTLGLLVDYLLLALQGNRLTTLPKTGPIRAGQRERTAGWKEWGNGNQACISHPVR